MRSDLCYAAARPGGSGSLVDLVVAREGEIHADIESAERAGDGELVRLLRGELRVLDRMPSEARGPRPALRRSNGAIVRAGAVGRTARTAARTAPTQTRGGPILSLIRDARRICASARADAAKLGRGVRRRPLSGWEAEEAAIARLERDIDMNHVERDEYGNPVNQYGNPIGCR